MKQRARMSGEERACDKDSDGEEAVQLRALRPEHYVEAQVQPGDTLQALALRFHCPISELKRINQIHKDNEIFARRTIKVPVTPYSVLTEVLPPEPEPVPSTSNGHLHQHRPEETSPEHVIDYNAAILNSVIAPAVVPYTDDTELAERPEERTLLIPTRRERESVETVVVKQLTSQGADLGIKWFHLVLFALLLGVVVPLLYVALYVERHEHELHPLGLHHPPH